MTLFETLLIAHVIGDWLLQTEWQALNKSTNWRALMSHVAVYHAVVLAALGWRIGLGEPLVYAVVAGLAVAHVVLDRKRPVVAFMRAFRISVKREPEGWLMIAVDQSIHLVLIGIATHILTR
jgi:uncharacterized membrane protein